MLVFNGIAKFLRQLNRSKAKRNKLKARPGTSARRLTERSRLIESMVWGDSTQRRPIQRALAGFIETLEVRTVPAYTMTLSSLTATVVGDAGADTLTITAAGGFLEHNRFAAGDAGFEGADDWDSTQAGIQQLAASATSIINLDTSGGADAVNWGTNTVAASTLLATLNYNAGGNSGDTLTIDDGFSSTGKTYTVQSTSMTATGIAVNMVSTTITGGKTLRTSSSVDTVNVLTVAAAEPVNITTSGGADAVNINGVNGVQNIAATVSVANPNSRSALTIDNTGDTTGRTYTVTESQTSGLAPVAINYVANDISQLTIINGSGSDTINVTPTAEPQLAIAINGAGPATLPGDQLSLTLGGATGTALEVTGTDSGVYTFSNRSPITYSNIETVNIPAGVPVTVQSGAGSDTVNVSRSGANVVVTVNGTTVLDMPAANITGGLIIDGEGGDDALTVDLTNGVLPTLTFNGGTSGATGDSLRTIGGNFATGVSTPSSANDGSIVYTGGTTGNFTLNYTGLEPIDDLNVVADYTIDATNAVNDINIVDGPIVLGTQTTQVNDGNGLFELQNVANKAILRINGLDAADTITFNNPTKGVGINSFIVSGDNGDDQIDINTAGLVTGTAYTFNGGANNDVFNVSGGLLGVDITINGDSHTGVTPATQDRLNVDSATAAVTRDGDQLQFAGGSTITADTVEQINLTNLNSITEVGDGGADTAVLSKPTATGYRSVLNGGVELNFTAPAAAGAQYIFNAGSGSDTLTVDNNGRIVNLRVSYDGNDGANDTLNVFGNPGAVAARETYIVGASQDIGRVVVDPDDNIGFLRTSAIAPNGDELDINFTGLDPINTDVPAARYDIVLSDDADIAQLSHDGVLLNGAQSMILVDANNTFETTRFANKGVVAISGAEGNDTISWDDNGNVSALLASLEFSGFLPASLPGDDALASDVNRDVVEISDLSGAARNVTLDYSTVPADIQVNGTTRLVVVTTSETLRYDGGGNDAVEVAGTPNDDELTVFPYANDSALVFLGGDPWDGPEFGSMFDQFPGVAGGSAGPDLQLTNINNLTMNGDGSGPTGDRLFVYGQSQSALTTGSATDYFGFGAGVVMPSAAGLGFANAFDVITMSDSTVSIDAANGATPLLDVDINTASFVQPGPNTFGLTVNSGDEAAPGIVDSDNGLRADNIFLTPSTTLSMVINGGDPVPAFAPTGDKLNILGTFERVDVYSDKANPPQVTTVLVPIGGPANADVGFSSIEFLAALSAQRVRLIGDNNNVATEQTDNFVVVGRDTDSQFPGGDADGANEFTVQINGSIAYGFRDVQFLDVFGADVTGVDGGQIDTLEITPYADATPRGWGIATTFDEDAPIEADGDQADLLIIHTSQFGGSVSEAIVVQPTQQDNGEVTFTNAAFGTPIANITYINNTDIIVLDDDGSLSDGDSLTLRGTNPNTPAVSGNDRFTINLQAAGDAANPLVIVRDNADGGAQLYRVRNFTGFGTLFVEMLNGADVATVIGRDDGDVAVDIDGGTDSLVDAVTFLGTVDAADEMRYLVGPENDTALAFVKRSGAPETTRTNLSGVDTVTFDLGGGAAADTMFATGSFGQDQVTVNATTALSGTIAIGNFPILNYLGLGSGGASSVALAASNVVAGALDNLQVIGTGGADTYTYTPTSSNTAGLTLLSGGDTVNFGITNFGTVALDALNPATIPGDELEVTVANAIITPGATSDSGTVTATNSGGQGLLPLTFSHIESANVTGTTVVVNGTEGDDLITVSDTGVVTVTNQGGIVLQTYDLSGATSLILNGLGGDDTFEINGSALFTGGIDVIGGDNGDGSDELTYFGTGGAAVTVNLANQTIREAGLFEVSFTGIETLNAAVDDAAFNITGTEGADVVTFWPDSANSGQFSVAGTDLKFNYFDASSITANLDGSSGDVVRVMGSEANDAITSPTPSSIAVNGEAITVGTGVERLEIYGGGGNDNITLGLNLAGVGKFIYGGEGNDVVNLTTTIDATVFGGLGDDTITGTAVADYLSGDEGNDTIDGLDGDDVLLGGDDHDIIIISGATPGNDTVSGGTGDDWLLFDPTPATTISLRESAGLLRVDTGANVTLASDISQVLFNSTGAGVSATVRDLSGVGVDRVGFDFNGGGVDSLIVEGTAGADTISVGRELTNPNGDQLATVNLAWGRVSAGVISAAAGDRITINGLDGDDTITSSASVMSAAVVPGSVGDALVTLNGGLGNDTLTAGSIGGQAGLLINGNEGDDTITGGLGNDTFDGGAGDDTFVGGGGTDNVGGGAGSSVGDTVLVTGTSGNDVIALSLDATGHLLATVNGVTTTYQNFVGGAFATSGIERILVDGLNGNDQLTVDSTNGTIAVPITYNGGAGSDTLTLSGGIATSDTYTVGPDVGSGSSVIVIGGVTQTVNFTGLEPVIDLVGGPLVVNGTNAANNINYSQGSVAANGLVSVDSFETIEFSNKTDLTINALAGSDTINLNNGVTPTGLATITVNAGDATDGDTLVINGRSGFQDQMRLAPTGAGAGTITQTGRPDIAFTGTDNIRVVLDPGASDHFTIDGTAGNDTFYVTSGATTGTMKYEGLMNVNGGAPFNLPVINVTGQSNALIGTLNFNGAGGTDTLVITGTDLNDTFNINRATATSGNVDHDVNGVQTNFIGFANFTTLIVNGLDGDDTFRVTGDVPLNVQLNGGNPSAGSDVINFVGSAVGGLITIDESVSTITQAGFATVSYTGIEDLNVDGTNLAGVVVQGLTGVDAFTVTPTGNASATISDAGVNTAISVNNVTGLTVNGNDGVVPTNTLTVVGSQQADTIAVDLDSVDITGALSVQFVDIQSVIVRGEAGSDTFNVTPAGAPPISIFGGDPSATSPGDVLNVTSAAAVTVSAGPEPDAGSVQAGADLVTFDEIENVSITLTGAGAAGAVVVNATNGDDDITVIGTGANDFTVSINDGPAVQFADATSLAVNALSGDDDIDLDLGALTIPVSVDGGLPGVGSDTLSVHATAGNDTIGFSPSNTLGAGTVTVNAVPPIAFTTIEHVIVDGRGGTDALTHTTAAGTHQVTFTPGVSPDAASINTRIAGAGFGPLTSLEYLHLGAGAIVNFASGAGVREDVLELYGTNDSDVFNVNGAADRIQILNPTSGFVTTQLGTAGISDVQLRALDGDDVFNVSGALPYSTLLLDAGNSTSGDTANLSGATGPVTVNLGASTTVTGYGGSITVLGLETLNTATGGQNLTVNGTAGNDDISVSPTGAAAATVRLTSSNPSVGGTPVINGTGIGTFAVSGGAGTDVVTVNGTAGADTIGVDRTTSTVTVNAFEPVVITGEAIVVASGLGDDVINVTGNGATALTVDGGQPTASDTLNVTASVVTVNYGTDPATGTVNDVSFLGIEHIGLTGDGAGSLTINGTNGNDSINQSGNTVTVNNGATVDFAAYPTLTLNGNNGDDQINVDPTTLAGVTTFNVDGGNPTASDELIVNGTAGSDTIGYNPSDTIGSGSVTVNAAPAVNFTTTESVVIDGQGGTDDLTHTTPGGVHQVTYTPGVAPDAGTIGTRGAGGGTGLVPLTFNHIGAGGSVSFASAGGREDVLELNGTNDSDVFDVTGAADTIQIQNPTGGFVTDILNTAGIDVLELRGLDGDDTFNLSGTLPYSTVLVDAGNPSASDVVNLTTPTGAVAVTLGGTTSVTGYGANVDLIGVEILNADTNGQNLTINGTAGNDVLSVTPTGANAATVSLISSDPDVGSTPVINGSAIGTFNVNLAGGADRLVVNATQAGEILTADGTLVTVGAFETVNYTNTEDLHLVGLAGSDTFNVTPALATTIFVDGGDPIGATPGDQLNLFPPAAFVVEPGPENDEGGIRGLLMQRVSWDHIEGITISGPGPAKIVGTNGDDDITIVARDASTHAGANGVRDFTVSLNDGIAILFLDQATLLVDALAGDDDIVVRAPAPNGAVWNVQLTVAGGTPAAATGDQGDVLEYETPGQQTITYTPGAIPGTGVINDTTLASSITIAQFVCPVDGLPSSAGSIENLILDGEGGNDSVTVIGSGAADSFVLTPGSLVDSGSIAVNNQLGVTYEDLGAGATLAIDGAGGSDTVTVDGTANADVFGVLANGNVTLAGHLTLTRTNYENLILRGQNGDDIFNVDGGTTLTTVTVEGGDPSASDVLNYTATANAATTVDLNVSTISQAGPAGETVVLNGIERVNLTSSGAASTLTVNGTSGDDTIDVTPTGAGVGSFVRLGLGGAPQFTYTGVGGAFTVAGGSGGFDTLGILGDDAADTVTSTATTVTIKGGTVTLGAGLEYLNITTFGGDDNVTLTGLAIAKTIDGGTGNDLIDLSAAVDATIFGGLGDDTLIGSPVADLIYGGSGNDILIGGGGVDQEYGEDGNDQFGDLSLGGNGVANDPGADFLFGGAGADTFVWEPGDGSDAIQGGDDEGDSLRFIGSAAANIFTLSANTANPSHFNLNLGAATVDTSGIEQVILSALAGADTVTVGDLSTTEIEAVNIDLGAGDADAVTVNGRNVADNLAVSSAAAGSVGIQGLGYDVNITTATTADTLTVNGNEGDDTIKVNALVETTIGIVLNGNDGDDFLSADATINGGNGNDTIEGGAGADTLNGNAGDDIFIFNAGTGIDTIDGGTGGDTFLIETNILANTISVSETAVTVDGGTENLAISNVELFHVKSNFGNDTITVSLATVAGLIEAGAGNDSVNGSATTSSLTIFGEDGNDTLTGSSGADLIFGGAGNDVIIGGAGIDHEYGEDGNDQFGDLALTGNGVADDAGNDLVFGGAGADIFIWEPGDGSDDDEGGDDEGDVLRFLGSAAANAFLLSANGIDPTHFDLNLGAATVNTAGVEQVILSALAGADSVTVNDLATTEIKAVNIDLGVGDADAVTYNGRNIADDLAISSPAAGSVTFQGLGYDLNILNAAVADTLTVNGNEGDDSIKANAGVESTITIVLNGNDGDDFLSADATLNGGNGDDVLVGGAGIDTINGNDGDDILTGNGGADNINGGAGYDTVFETRNANFTITNTTLVVGAEGTDTLTSIEQAHLVGGAGNNNFDIGAFTGDYIISGRNGSDTVDFHESPEILRIDMDLVDDVQILNLSGQALLFEDIVENVIATDFNDVIQINIAQFNRFVDGGVETSIPPGDRLYVDMLGSNPASTKVPNGKLGSYDGTVNGAGFTGTITYEDIETLAIQNPNGGGGPNGGIPIDFGAATDYPISNGPHGVIAEDVNGDGILDMVVAAKLAGTVSVRFGNGFGGFGAEAIYNSGAVKKERSITVASSDVDNDGDLDIVVTNRKDNSVGVLLNNGAGVFTGPTTFSTGVGKLGKFPMSVKIGDMNNDGNDDIVTTNASKGKKHSSIAILLGNGAGSFGTANTTLVEGRKARDLVLGDFDQDGNLDVVATNLFSREIVFMAGNGAGGLAAPVSFPTGWQPTSIISADFNGDGLTDVAVTCQVSKEISVLYGTGAPGIFSETLGIKYPNVKLEISINSADLNGDGNADLIIANRVTNTLSYMLGLGNGTFDTRVDFKVGGVHGREPVAIAWGDFNNDGAIDLMVANAGTDDVSVLLRNPIV